MGNATKVLEDLIKGLKTAVSQTNTRGVMSEIARSTKNRMKDRIESGRGVSSLGGKTHSFKPLASATVNRRRDLAAKGKLSYKTSPARSNIIRTQQLWNSILSTSIGTNKGRIYIESIRSTGGKSNTSIASELEASGFKFFNLSGSEINQLARDYGVHLITNLDRALKKSR